MALSKKINKNLTKEQELILFSEETESPGSSLLNYENREGYFCCVNCGLKLFESNKKFESGSKDYYNKALIKIGFSTLK